MENDNTLDRHEEDIKNISQGMNNINITLAVLATKMEEILVFAKSYRDSGMEIKVIDLVEETKGLKREMEILKDFKRESEFKDKNLTHFFTRWFPLIWIISSALWSVFNFALIHSH